MYSEEFKNLVESELTKNSFIGFGNPNAKILIVGKEVSNSNDKEGMNFYKRNTEIWKSNIKNNIKQEDINDCSIEHNPLFAYKGLTKKENISDTWTNYQKLHDIIFERKDNSIKETIINFQKDFFLTEMSEMPAKTTKTAQEKIEFKEKLKKRKAEFFNKNAFIQNFPVVVLACSNYIWNKENDLQIKDIFDVTYSENKEYPKGFYESSSKNRFWIHYSANSEKLVIHTRQLSNHVKNDMLIEMGKIINQHLKNL